MAQIPTPLFKDTKGATTPIGQAMLNPPPMKPLPAARVKVVK